MIPLKDPILVTSALPYANGDIHIGHLVEYIQTDIYVRFLKMCEHDTIYMCASDTHGTPVELKARELGVKPEDLVARYNGEHLEDFKAFQIEFDRFYTTHSDETRKHSENIFSELGKRGLIEKREVEQTYCEHDQRFLPDRYISGTCPKCGAEDQYGDNCQVCGATYEPTDMDNAKCILCGQAPQRKKSVHYFFKLSECKEELDRWVGGGGHLHETTKNWVEGTFLKNLRDWDISRDAPYFGFLIPGEKDKYFYVWLDAPVGYIGTTDKYCRENNLDFDRYWRKSESTVIHFIGKDIAYFHTLFWPAMLMNSGYHVPDRVQVHGFLTVNGEKMSKRTGTAVKARTYLKHLDPQYLRYYYACKLGPTNADIDLNLEDFVFRVNADAVNKVANLASRTLALLNKRLDNRIGRIPDEDKDLLEEIQGRLPEVKDFYGRCEFGKAMRVVMEMAERANKHFQDQVPFRVVDSEPEKARGICATSLNLLKMISGALKPVLPHLVKGVEESMGLKSLLWDDLCEPLENVDVNTFERLIERVDKKKVQAVIDESKSSEEEKSTGDSADSVEPVVEETAPFGDIITIDTFAKVDLRVGKVLEVEDVKEARALLKFTLDLGSEKRQVFAGLKEHYKPEDLVGKNVIVVANLKPRKMRFGTSDGMVLAATSGEKVTVLEVPGNPAPGSKVS